MLKPGLRWVVSAVAFGAALGVYAGEAGQAADAALSAGSFTIARTDAQAFSEPAPVLSPKQRQMFKVGRSVFNRQWASVVSLNGDWGLGPTFIADRCSTCHVNAGRGSPPAAVDEQLLSMLVRVSVPGAGPHGGPLPHPHYGGQIQNRSLDGSNNDLAYGPQAVPAEAQVYLGWEARSVAFADGESVTLRKPVVRIENPNFGVIGPEVMTSLRIAQPVFGLGFLEAVPESAMHALALEQRRLGFDGRPNLVWDAIAGRTAIGRFGWKANEASLKQQIASAAFADMGLSSRLFPEQNCPPIQEVCVGTLPGNFPEIINHEIDALELWLRGLAVPARRNMGDPEVRRGEQLFGRAQCSVCHVPELKTGPFPEMPQLANQSFRAYTDMLLHDMGDELADGRPDFQAGPRDWRTPPLWGLGLLQTVSGSTALLHDGRARNVTEAILWHGGEAQGAREAFRNMTKAEREALVRFVEAI